MQSGSGRQPDDGISVPAVQPHRAAAFFDLGHTVIARSSVLAYRKSFLNEGLFSASDAVRTISAQALLTFAIRNDERIDSTRDLLASLVTNWPASTVRRIAREGVEELVSPWVYAEARALIERHHAAGRDVIIVSASPDFTVLPIAEELGVDNVVSTRLAEENGLFTGHVEFFCKGEEKEKAIQRLVQDHHYDLSASYAYSDSASDLPMLRAVGHPTAVNPDRALRKIATEAGWPILNFKHPVPLFPALPSPSRTALTSIGAAVAVGTLATIAAAHTIRRRRS